MKTDSFSQFVFADLAPPPFVENMLVARKDRLESQNNRTFTIERAALKQRPCKTLAGGQGVIVANQHQVGALDFFVNLIEFDNGLIGAVCLTEIPQILAAAVGVIGADFAFYTLQRMQLRRRPTRS